MRELNLKVLRYLCEKFNANRYMHNVDTYVQICI